jgi:RNA polymerase sigma factor (TIGR02999 family)
MKGAVDLPITQLLEQLRTGDPLARQQLMDVSYDELRRIARAHLRRERPDHTLQPTALVHEAYVRVFGGTELPFADRVHFFAVISQVMRRVLVDHARARSADRRGGGMHRVPWDATLAVELEGAGHQLAILDLDRAITALGNEKAALAQVIELQYFGGMTAEEIAEAAGRSVHVVRHEIRFAQAWLKRELTRAGKPASAP